MSTFDHVMWSTATDAEAAKMVFFASTRVSWAQLSFAVYECIRNALPIIENKKDRDRLEAMLDDGFRWYTGELDDDLISLVEREADAMKDDRSTITKMVAGAVYEALPSCAHSPKPVCGALVAAMAELSFFHPKGSYAQIIRDHIPWELLELGK